MPPTLAVSCGRCLYCSGRYSQQSIVDARTTRFPLVPIAITERMIAGMSVERGNVRRTASLVMTVLLLVLLGAILPSTFRRTSSAVAYLSASQAWTLVGAILGAMGSCIVRIVCELLMPIEGAKHVKKSAWLVGTNWIPELVPLVCLVVLNWPSLQQSALLNPVSLECAR